MSTIGGPSDQTRREFVSTFGTVAAAAVVHPGRMIASSELPQAVTARRMVVRADDIGFSNVCNIGSFEAIERGVVTSADVMLESPGTVDALERLRSLPWISLGWHMHMWGAPVLGAARVPSLVERSGPFAGRFRESLSDLPDVDHEEAVAELSAQLERCQRIIGRLPVTGDAKASGSPWGRAVQKVAVDAGIAFNFMEKARPDPAVVSMIQAAQRAGAAWSKSYPATFGTGEAADPRWAGRRIVSLSPLTAYKDLMTDSIAGVESNYDPVLYYTEDRAGILRYPSNVVTEQSWHPGYVDYYVYRQGERFRRARAQQFVVGRVQDVAALCDQRLRDWIRQNRVALVSLEDALHGTTKYQDHLHAVGSDLSVAV